MPPLHRESYQPRRSAALFAILASLPVGTMNGQTESESPSALVRSLSKERPKGQPIIAIFRCGLINGPLRERQTAGELVQLGRAALPGLERALDSVEKKGWQSDLYENARWLFFAYARILGSAAAPRLLRMRKNPKLADARRSIDDALALSLGLTSYVSGMDGPSPSLGCRGEQPRDALDQMVESLERGNLAGLQKVLGPDAREALDHALEARSWETLLGKTWSLQPDVDYALGFRFEMQGPWSEPEETLEQPREEYKGPLLAADKFSIETQFTDSAGKDCGRHKVDFLTAKAPPNLIQDIYRIDNADIESLLRTIGRCAAE
jgi:hypothetical protein